MAMLADHTLTAALIGLLLCSGAAARAADEDVPDIEFLEYLGMWEESDEDWLILDRSTAADSKERSDPAPQGEESMETDDEG